jgi:hypothetical protein
VAIVKEKRIPIQQSTLPYNAVLRQAQCQMMPKTKTCTDWSSWLSRVIGGLHVVGSQANITNKNGQVSPNCLPTIHQEGRAHSKEPVVPQPIANPEYASMTLKNEHATCV